jgi:hypothetical protein
VLLSSVGLSSLVSGTRLCLAVIWDSGRKYFNRKFTAPIHPLLIAVFGPSILEANAGAYITHSQADILFGPGVQLQDDAQVAEISDRVTRMDIDTASWSCMALEANGGAAGNADTGGRATDDGLVEDGREVIVTEVEGGEAAAAPAGCAAFRRNPTILSRNSTNLHRNPNPISKFPDRRSSVRPAPTSTSCQRRAFCARQTGCARSRSSSLC